jgi:hypothetical protein
MNDASTIDEEDDQEALTPKVQDKPPAQAAVPVVRAQVNAQASVMALTPRNLDEAWRMAEAFRTAGMVPKSLEGKGEKETTAKVMLAILKGAEVGYAPVTAVSTIMIINNKTCLYGDGATALVQSSGKVEWIKTSIESKDSSGKWGEGYKVTVSLKRKDQEEPYVRCFSFEDAKRARLTGKQGPWTDYPERQCYWRAWSWCARDGAADALMGLAVAEEVRDYAIEAARGGKTDTSDLDDAPTANRPKEDSNAST